MNGPEVVTDPASVRLEPGETRVLIDGKGGAVTFLYRHPLSIDPRPSSLTVPIGMLLVVTAQAILASQQGAGMLTPNALPDAGGKLKM